MSLASAMLMADVSREEAKEDEVIREYLEGLYGNAHQDAVWKLVGSSLGTALGGPLGGFLAGQLGSNLSRYRRGGFDRPPMDMNVGKFNRSDRLNQLTDLEREHEMFGATHLMDMGTDFMQTLNLAGGLGAIQDEGLGTLLTTGTGPGAKSGWIGTTKKAGGSGIGLGGWKGMKLNPASYQAKTVGPGLPQMTGPLAQPQLTAGQVYKSPPGISNWFRKAGGLSPKGATPSFWSYQLGGVPKASPYSVLTPAQKQQQSLQNFYNLIQNWQSI